MHPPIKNNDKNHAIKSLSALGNFRIVLDECWQHEEKEIRQKDRIWYERIPCSYNGHISLYCMLQSPCSFWKGGCSLRRPDCRTHINYILRLWTPSLQQAKNVWRHIKKHPSCHLSLMDGEAEIYFPAHLLPIVAELVKAKRKRQRKIQPG